MNRYLKGVVTGSAILLLLVAVIIPAWAQRKSVARAKRAEDLFNGNCARCHGPDGRGQTALGKVYQAADFTDQEWWKKNARLTNTTTMKATIAKGKAGMPAFGKKLTSAEISLLVNRVRAFRRQR